MDRTLRICLVTEYFHPDDTGGTPTVLSTLARYLADHHPDLAIDVVTSRNSYRVRKARLAPFEDWKGVRITRVACPRSNRPSAMLRMLAGQLFALQAFRTVLFRRRYDLVFVGTNPPVAPSMARALRRMTGTPYAYLIHDLFPDLAMALGILPAGHPVARLAKAAQRRWLHAADRVLVLGRCMRDYLVAAYGVPADRISVIPNWSDPEKIRPLPKTTRFRAAHDLTGFVVLYAGNFGQYQHFDDILLAAKLLRTREPDVTFVLVGGGARRDYLAEYIEKEKLDNVRMFPFVPVEEFPDLLASADVSLTTLEPGAEGLGVPSKFYNILASGRPTVAIMGAGCEVARVLEEERCGRRVPQGNPQELADTLAELRHAPLDLESMGERARQALLSHYTIQHVAEQFRQTFESIAGVDRAK
jgi:colanic acid biosynthesis glycosyl transferase WcaI